MKNQTKQLTDNEAIIIANRLTPDVQNNNFQFVKRKPVKKVTTRQNERPSTQQRERDLQLEQFKLSKTNIRTKQTKLKDKSHITQLTRERVQKDNLSQKPKQEINTNKLEQEISFDILSLAIDGTDSKSKTINKTEIQHRSDHIEHDGVTLDLLSLAL